MSEELKMLADVEWLIIGSTDEYAEVKSWIAHICRDVTKAACIDEICINDICIGLRQKGYEIVAKSEIDQLRARIAELEADAERLAEALLPIRLIYAIENTAADGAYFDRGVSLSKAEVRKMQAALAAHEATKDGPP